ncbi:MAG: hypothetical protein EPN74_00330 [Rhodanobacter sp.]|nr:MAG: hypothetical protein EPN74_00330 [Rhodanobacter sp.]
MRNILFRLIGILEIAGGLYGVAAMLRRLLPFHSTHGSVLALLGLALFGFVLAAGVQLVDGSERGVRMSRWAQLLQVPLIATPVFSYALHCGAYLNLYDTLHLARPWLDWNLGSQGFGLALTGPAHARFGVNLLAVLSWLALKLR